MFFHERQDTVSRGNQQQWRQQSEMWVIEIPGSERGDGELLRKIKPGINNWNLLKRGVLPHHLL